MFVFLFTLAFRSRPPVLVHATEPMVRRAVLTLGKSCPSFLFFCDGLSDIDTGLEPTPYRPPLHYAYTPPTKILPPTRRRQDPRISTLVLSVVSPRSSPHSPLEFPANMIFSRYCCCTDTLFPLASLASGYMMPSSGQVPAPGFPPARLCLNSPSDIGFWTALCPDFFSTEFHAL